MYELIKAGKNTFYIQSPAKTGIYRINEKEVCLIDSGSDKDAGRKISQILRKNNWTLTAIYNTHSNADHIGGNQYLQKQTGCKIYSPGIECDFTNHPILEPSFLYGGFPPPELRHKFILAGESNALPLTDDVLPEGLTMFSLPGHFFDMVGFRTDDDVVFLADCLSSRETIEKYAIGFIYDVEGYLETLCNVKNMQASVFVPSHAEECTDITPLADYNIKKVNEICDKICNICAQPVSTENILRELFCEYSLTMNFQQYALVGSTVRSYLSYLKNQERLSAVFGDNMLLWIKK